MLNAETVKLFGDPFGTLRVIFVDAVKHTLDLSRASGYLMRRPFVVEDTQVVTAAEHLNSVTFPAPQESVVNFLLCHVAQRSVDLDCVER